MTTRAVLRFLVNAWIMQLRLVTTARLYILSAVFIPIVFASLGFYVFQDSRPGSGMLVAVGAALMGMWSAALLSSGAAIDRQRRVGLLESLVAAPMPLSIVLLPVTVASATLGLYSLVATLLWGILLFGVDPTIAHPGLFAVSMLTTIGAVGTLGLLIASSFVRYPAAQGLSNMLEYPVWILSGLVVPLTFLPGPVQWLASALAPAWGMRALQASVTGTESPAGSLAICAGLGVVYFALAVVLMRQIEQQARASATIGLS
jgi:ABC-2 type transport system permease protein